jgi:uncharacterized OsmC-like protein
MTNLNGIDVEALNQMIATVKKQPDAARARFAVVTRVEQGFRAHSEVGQPALGGQALQGRTHTFRLEGDHPPELLGKDAGPAAVETVLAALGSCIGSGYTTFGAAMGIPIEAVRLEVTGDVDLQGFMGLPSPGAVRPGFQRIHARTVVRSKAPREQLEKLRETAENASPVRDSLRAVPFTSELVVERP